MTSYPFQPNASQNFVFNPVLDGVTYVATITWNVFGQRWYLNLVDVSGNLILCTAVASSADPLPLAALSWNEGLVTAQTVQPHNIPVGAQANLLLQGDTPSGFDGLYLVTATGPTSFTYELATDPGSPVQLGSCGGVVDLAAGLFDSLLLYFDASASFVTVP